MISINLISMIHLIISLLIISCPHALLFFNFLPALLILGIVIAPSSKGLSLPAENKLRLLIMNLISPLKLSSLTSFFFAALSSLNQEYHFLVQYYQYSCSVLVVLNSFTIFQNLLGLLLSISAICLRTLFLKSFSFCLISVLKDFQQNIPVNDSVIPVKLPFWP